MSDSIPRPPAPIDEDEEFLEPIPVAPGRIDLTSAAAAVFAEDLLPPADNAPAKDSAPTASSALQPDQPAAAPTRKKKAKNIEPAAMGFELRVAPELVALVKPISEFKLHPRNLRQHNLPAIQASLSAFGRQIPVVAQASTGFICKGNGTFKAATALGASRLAVSVEEFDDETAFRYLLADNRASDLAAYEKGELLIALRQLADGPGLTDTLWTADDIDDLAAEVGAITIAEPPDFDGDYFAVPEVKDGAVGNAAHPAGKMHEIPVTLTSADHALFMERIRVLKLHYGTTGTIATVVEAVRRQAQLVSATEAGADLDTGELPEEFSPLVVEASTDDLVALLD